LRYAKALCSTVTVPADIYLITVAHRRVRGRLLKRQTDLAEVLARSLVPECVGNLVKRIATVDYWLDTGCVDRADHVDLMPATADDQPLQFLLTAHQFASWHLPDKAR
jgi:hypothetical protein